MSNHKQLLIVLLGLSLWSASNVLRAEGHNGEPLAQQSQAATQRPGIAKIATVGALPSPVAGTAKFDAIVQHVINHWQSRFAQVLPDRPDLIVVPETCDVPSGLSGKRLFEYYECRGDGVLNTFQRSPERTAATSLTLL